MHKHASFRCCQISLLSGYLFGHQVQFIPAEDLQTIDELWKAASGGLFGYSVQREIWMQNRKYWTRFFKAISWVTGERNNYRSADGMHWTVHNKQQTLPAGRLHPEAGSFSSVRRTWAVVISSAGPSCSPGDLLHELAAPYRSGAVCASQAF